MTRMNKKIKAISFLQVIGPILVILGHSLNGFPEGFGLWRVFSKDWIYLFHMPLFFFISGFLFQNSLYKYEYIEFIKNKMMRLLIPYILLNLIFLLPKAALGAIVGDKISIGFYDIFIMFLTPRENIWGHTWFMFCLFLVYTLYPLWKMIICKHLWILTFIVLLIISLWSPKIYFMTISDFTFNLLFFFFGIVLFQYRKQLSSLSTKQIFFLVISMVMLSISLQSYYNVKLIRILLAVVIIFTLYCLGYIFEFKSVLFTFISKNSFWIYLLHWPFMLATRVIFLRMGISANLVVMLMILVGFSGPIITIKVYKEFIYGRYFNHI